MIFMIISFITFISKQKKTRYMVAMRKVIAASTVAFLLVIIVTVTTAATVSVAMKTNAGALIFCCSWWKMLRANGGEDGVGVGSGDGVVDKCLVWQGWAVRDGLLRLE